MGDVLDSCQNLKIPLVINEKKKHEEVAKWFVPRLRSNRKPLSNFVDQSYIEDFDRVSKDVAQTQELAKALDAEKGFKNTFLYDQVEDDAQDRLQPIKQFHWILCYLRNVHLYSYYRHQQYATEEELFNKDIIVEL